MTSNETPELVPDSELFCSFAGFVLGAFVTLLGCFMFYFAVIGREPWGATVFGSPNVVVDALPGAVVLILGLLLIRGTRRKAPAK